MSSDELSSLRDLLVSLAIGLLIGLERERNPTAKAGLRTFALVGLAGGLSQHLASTLQASALVAVGLAAVSFAITAAYYHHHEDFHERDPGTTTILAVIVCYLLGALAAGPQRQLAVMMAIAVAALLYFKAELSGAVRGLDRRDLLSILQFAVVAFVVLPLLPDRGFGPDGVLNPRQVWFMVVLISGVSLAGYVALRLAGPRVGSLLVGLLGGLVSSTATTLSFSRIARERPEAGAMAATAVVTANLVLPARVLALAAALAPEVAWKLALPLAAAVLAGALAFTISRTSASAAVPDAFTLGNPARLRTAIGFAAMYGVVLAVAAWVGRVAGDQGVYLVAAVSGTTDLDAISLSAIRMHSLGAISARQAALAVVLALVSNTVFKAAIVAKVGGASIARMTLPSLASMAAAAIAAAAVFVA